MIPRPLVLVGLVSSLVVAGALQSVAAQPDRQARSEGRHCVVDLDRREAPAECFRSLKEAVSAATDGAVALPASAKAGDAAEILRRHAVQTTSRNVSAQQQRTVISIQYWDAEYDGRSFLATTQQTGGCRSRTYSIREMPVVNGRNWNDELSSIEAVGLSCRATLFEDNNFAGNSRVCNPKCDRLGWMNDETSSTGWD